MKKTLLLLFMLACAIVLRAQNFEVGLLSFAVTIKSGNGPYTAEVIRSSTKITDKLVTEIVIPETVEKDGIKYTITSIGESAFTNCYLLSTVVIPNTVKSIGNYAFSGCSGLRVVNIPSSVTSIGVAAFFNCKNLKYVTIPNSVKTIGNGAFNNENCIFICQAESRPSGWVYVDSHWSNRKGTAFWNSFLEDGIGYQFVNNDVVSLIKVLGNPDSVAVPMIISHLDDVYMVKSISSNAFADTDISVVEIPITVTDIGDNAFANCTWLTAVRFSSSVKNIGKGVFSGCTSLKTITLPGKLSSIGENLFANCTALTTVTIPNSVKNIGKGAFSSCIELASVVIPNSVTDIGENAFVNCTALKSVTISNSVKNISKNAFSGCTELASVTIPNSVTEIGENAFANCIALKSVTISNSAKNIGKGAFGGCAELASVTIPNSVTDIGDNAFAGCTGLKMVTISNSVKSIGKNVFSNCSSLGSVTIPNSVKSISSFAFTDCGNLTTVVIPKSVTTISSNAFNGNKIVFYCEHSARPEGWTADAKNNSRYWNNNLGQINWEVSFISDSIAYFITSDNTVTAKGYLGHGELLRIPSSAKCENFEYNVVGIGQYAFSGCESVTTVFIPKSVASIGEKAFNGCKNIKNVSCETGSWPSGWATDCFPNTEVVKWGQSKP
jgi:hypothetical protein